MKTTFKYLLLILLLQACIDSPKPSSKQLDGSYIINEISYKNKPYKEALSINTVLIAAAFISLPKTTHYQAEEALWELKTDETEITLEKMVLNF